jgi:MFS family permease
MSSLKSVAVVFLVLRDDADSGINIQIPCNIILKRTTPRFWLPTLTILWGVVATLMGIVQDLTGFFIARFFLGVAESGLFPGVVYYFSMWYQRRERQFRISLFFGAAALAGSFGGILAYVSTPILARWTTPSCANARLRRESDTWPVSCGKTVGAGFSSL